MIEFMEYISTNGTEFSFALLFVGLFVYIMKQNEKREADYQDTLKNNQGIISDTVKALNGYTELKKEIEKLSEKIDGRKGGD